MACCVALGFVLTRRSRPARACALASLAVAFTAAAQNSPASPPSPAPPAPEPAATTTPSPATTEPREVEIVRKDRSRLRGELISQDENSIVLSISGLRIELPMSEVETLQVLASVEDRYAMLRQAINDQDVDALLNLARWLRERERYALAHREVERVLAVEPANTTAQELKRQLEAQMRVLGQSLPSDPAASKEPAPRGPQRPGEALLPPQRDDFPLLTDEQINLIRVFETDLRDPPRMIIRRSTVDAFLDKYAGSVVEGRGMVPVNPEGRKQFLAQRPATILSWFFDLRAREFYPQVQVEENPRSMRLFRDNVHRTWLMNSCATTKCHGGEEAGRLYLTNRNPASDRSAYTNFLILERFRTSQGLPLIDYNQPANSPLLQFGLPRDRAALKHPEAGGQGRRWTPAFTSEDDPRFRQAVQWIESMFDQRPEYPIDYQAPVPAPLRAATEPDPAAPPPAPR